jgi:hypothetical protein
MTRLFLTACVAGSIFLHGVSWSQAQSTNWTGIMDITVDTAGACGDDKGNKHLLYYRPYINAGDEPSAIVLALGGATVYLRNKNLTSQFEGSGTLSATVIVAGRNSVRVVKTANGSYNMTVEPAVITGATTTIKVSAGIVKVTLPDLGICTFRFRSILGQV